MTHVVRWLAAVDWMSALLLISDSSPTSRDVRLGPISAEIRCLRYGRSAPNNGLMSGVAATSRLGQERLSGHGLDVTRGLGNDP